MRPQNHLRTASLFLLLLPATVGSQDRTPSPVSLASQHLARAEAALREQEPALAESEYRFAVEAALTSLGLLDLNQGQWTPALQSFQ
ncbi:MAG: hypothetical protein ACRD2M_09600, partial [Terriglobales bacterium]